MANEKVDWAAMRAEYISSRVSYRELAQKYGVSFPVVCERGKKENWVELRKKAAEKSLARAMQKTADKTASNAAIAADLKHSLLVRLQKIEKQFPRNATEVRLFKDGKVTVFKIRDLTAAYKDLTEDMTAAVSQTNDLLQSLMDLERKAESGAEA